MNQTDTYLGYIGLIFFLLFYVICAIKYVKYWNQLKNEYEQLGIPWPFFSQEELNLEVKRSFFAAYRMIFSNILKTARIIFFTHADNPAIQKPLRGIRRCYLAFFIFPIILATALIVAFILLGGLH